jgi:acetamidase/formamidase
MNLRLPRRRNSSLRPALVWVLRVKPGDIIETESLYGDYYAKPGGRWPGEVGPFYVEGATPNDTLVVKILKLKPNVDHAVVRRAC